LADATAHQRYHILHVISSHGETGSGDVTILLEGAGRAPAPTTPAALWHMLHDLQPPHLVILNMCKGGAAVSGKPFGGLAEMFFHAGIPAVIAHRFPVRDGDAARFASRLYELLATGNELEEALAAARRVAGMLTPVLFMKCEHGQLFTIAAGAHPPAPNAAALFQKAQSCRADRRWAEAASYAAEAKLIDPLNKDIASFLEHALEEEALETFLDEAAHAERLEDWVSVANWLRQYVDRATAVSRPETEQNRHAQRLHAARALAGEVDPELAWRPTWL
jgi:hypothetical protein